METIYLDHAATTPLDDEVFSRMLPYFGGRYGNPSSMHASGRRAASALSEARRRVAATLGAAEDEVLFTGSGTESDNLAVIGAARANAKRGRHVIVSAIEHKAVLEAAHALEREGFEVALVPADAYGTVDPSAVLSLLRDDTILVSLMLANNEIGTIEPIADLSRALRERHDRRDQFPLLHTDACQAVGHLPIDVEMLGVDLMSLNGSKAYGPKGVGVLYKKRGVRLAPLIFGGGQEKGYRAGTESLPFVMGMAFALEKAAVLQAEESARLLELRKYFVAGLRARVPGLMVNGHPTRVLPHIVHVTVPDIEGESMVLLLDEAGIEAATGSACSASDLRPSHVLAAIGQSDDLMHGSIRFSMGRGTTRGELDRALEAFPAVVMKLKGISALTSDFYAKEKHVV
ncbi:cysteine desulfurase [Candidatus Parcubacteria bacterium]|nr:cysteine desulfurase [Candidatus Parcubacteria bacterium]